MFSADHGAPFTPIKVQVREALARLGRPATIYEILAEVSPPEGFTREFRDVIVEETVVKFWNYKGYPMRVAK
jgi:hypothetical protein